MPFQFRHVATVAAAAAIFATSNTLIVERVTAQDTATDDAQYIANLMTQQSVQDEMFRAMSPLIRQSMSGLLSRGPAANLKNASRESIVAQFIADFKIEFGKRMTELNRKTYSKIFSAAELAAFRRFLETPEGQSFAAKQAQFIRQNSQAGRVAGQQVGPIVAQRIGQRLATDGTAFISDANDLALLKQMFPAP